jgi:hypothetical protein
MTDPETFLALRKFFDLLRNGRSTVPGNVLRPLPSIAQCTFPAPVCISLTQNVESNHLGLGGYLFSLPRQDTAW